MQCVRVCVCVCVCVCGGRKRRSPEWGSSTLGWVGRPDPENEIASGQPGRNLPAVCMNIWLMMPPSELFAHFAPDGLANFNKNRVLSCAQGIFHSRQPGPCAHPENVTWSLIVCCQTHKDLSFLHVYVNFSLPPMSLFSPCVSFS